MLWCRSETLNWTLNVALWRNAEVKSLYEEVTLTGGGVGRVSFISSTSWFHGRGLLDNRIRGSDGWVRLSERVTLLERGGRSACEQVSYYTPNHDRDTFVLCWHGNMAKSVCGVCNSAQWKQEALIQVTVFKKCTKNLKRWFRSFGFSLSLKKTSRTLTRLGGDRNFNWSKENKTIIILNVSKVKTTQRVNAFYYKMRALSSTSAANQI